MRRLILLTLAFSLSLAAQVASDTFTGTDETTLQSHTSDSGHTWSLHPIGAGTNLLLNGGHLYAAATAGIQMYYISAATAAADYDVQADFTVGATSHTTPSICARVDTTVLAGYCVGWQSGAWYLYKYAAGEYSLLAGTETGYDPTTTRTVKLSVRGTTITVTVGGTQIYSLTDTSLAGAGRAGVSTYWGDAVNSRWIDNWSVSNLANTVRFPRRPVVWE